LPGTRRILTGNGGVGLLEIGVAALVVGLDNFAVALALAAMGEHRRRLRVTLTFSLFGGAAPAAGALIGMRLSAVLAGPAELVAAVVLAVIGVASIRSGVRLQSLDSTPGRVGTGTGLLLLAASVSTDNLAVGFGLGLHGARALPLAVACGISVGVLTAIGFLIGGAARRRWERWSLIAAGVLLVGMASAILLGGP
jgi:putative Mn2+ efflux pump MntP